MAASTRASTLHYCCNDREFAWGPVKPHDHKNQNDFALGHTKEIDPQVLLIDAGCEWNNYASDITRTIPVGNGGKFTPEARAIYELVLEMQAVCVYISSFFFYLNVLMAVSCRNHFPSSNQASTGTPYNFSAIASSSEASRSWAYSSRPIRLTLVPGIQKKQSYSQVSHRHSFPMVSDTPWAWTFMTSRVQASPLSIRLSNLQAISTAMRVSIHT